MFNLSKLLTLFTAVKALIGLVEPIKEAVHAVEQPGKGAAKKAAVLSLVNAAVDAGELATGVNLPNKAIESFASVAIDIVVSVENLAGRLKKPTKRAPKPAAEVPNG